MKILLELSSYSEQPLSTPVLLELLRGYRRPYDKIMELVRHGYLVQLRKGLYRTTSLLNSKTPEPFLIANHLYGPSYVSMDAAMVHWGLIPERFFEISCVTTKTSRMFEMEHVTYSYIHLPAPYYPLGIESVSLTERQTILIACPEKSVCDKVVTTSGVNLRSKNQVLDYLVEDLRMEKARLREFNLEEMVAWLPSAPKRKSIQILIEAIAGL